MKHLPRDSQRIYLTFYLRIYEGDTFLGYMIDFSRQGLMAMAEAPFDTDRTYNLKLKLPSTPDIEDAPDELHYITCTATCIWTRPDEKDTNFFLGGFEFVDLDDNTDAALHKLVEQFRLK